MIYNERNLTRDNKTSVLCSNNILDCFCRLVEVVYNFESLKQHFSVKANIGEYCYCCTVTGTTSRYNYCTSFGLIFNCLFSDSTRKMWKFISDNKKNILPMVSAFTLLLNINTHLFLFPNISVMLTFRSFYNKRELGMLSFA